MSTIASRLILQGHFRTRDPRWLEVFVTAVHIGTEDRRDPQLDGSLVLVNQSKAQFEASRLACLFATLENETIELAIVELQEILNYRKAFAANVRHENPSDRARAATVGKK